MANNNDISLKILTAWLLLAIFISFILGFLFFSLQYNIRSSANDPQIQMAEDAAGDLEGGRSPFAIIKSENVNIAQSLAPFLIIYNEHGDPCITLPL